MNGGQQGGVSENLLRFGADHAGVGFKEQVIGNGRRVAFDLQVAGQGVTSSLNVTWAFPPDDASHTSAGSAADGLVAAAWGLARWLLSTGRLIADADRDTELAEYAAVLAWW